MFTTIFEIYRIPERKVVLRPLEIAPTYKNIILLISETLIILLNKFRLPSLLNIYYSYIILYSQNVSY